MDYERANKKAVDIDLGQGPTAAEELRQLIERIEGLEEEKSAISGDIKDVFSEAKGRGYDVKTIKTVIRMRKKDANERAEEEAMLETYISALGMGQADIFWGGNA